MSAAADTSLTASAEFRLRATPPRAMGLRLGAEEVELWRGSLEPATPEAVSFFESLLSADEIARASRFFFERDRRRVIVSRGMLRLMLARYTGRRPSELRFHFGPNGKPALVRELGDPVIHFNVAHSDDLALYAFTTAGEVGIDVERVRELPEWEEIAITCFSPSETERIRAVSQAARGKEFLRAWTSHEAALKLSGLGLGGEQMMFDTRCSALAATAGRAIQPQIYRVDPGAGFVGALAVDAGVRWAICRNWSINEAAEVRFDQPCYRTPLEQFSQTEISFP